MGKKLREPASKLSLIGTAQSSWNGSFSAILVQLFIAAQVLLQCVFRGAITTN